MALYKAMAERFGPSGWWPAKSPFEVMVGAILTQNTSWVGAAKAVKNLEALGLLSPEAVFALSEEELAPLIRPSGAFNQKAKKLKALVTYTMAGFGGDTEGMARMETGRLRMELLSIKGIGPETADTILLYALNKPVFVVDAYTKRILGHHGLIDPKIGYDDLKGLFEKNLQPDVSLFKEFHAYFVLTGKNFCKKRPFCASCPLEPFLEGGCALDWGLKENEENPCLSLPC